MKILFLLLQFAAACVLAFFAVRGQWLQGFIWSLIPGTASIGLYNHTAAPSHKAPATRPRAEIRTPEQKRKSA